MDQYNAYGVQFDSGTTNPYLMQHQIQQMNDSIQEQQHRQMQHGFGYPSSGIDYPGMNDVMWYELLPMLCALCTPKQLWVDYSYKHE